MAPEAYRLMWMGHVVLQGVQDMGQFRLTVAGGRGPDSCGCSQRVAAVEGAENVAIVTNPPSLSLRAG